MDRNRQSTENVIVQNIRTAMLRQNIDVGALAVRSGVRRRDLEAALSGGRVLSSGDLVAVGRALGLTVHDLVADDSNDDD